MRRPIFLRGHSYYYGSETNVFIPPLAHITITATPNPYISLRRIAALVKNPKLYSCYSLSYQIRNIRKRLYSNFCPFSLLKRKSRILLVDKFWRQRNKGLWHLKLDFFLIPFPLKSIVYFSKISPLQNELQQVCNSARMFYCQTLFARNFSQTLLTLSFKYWRDRKVYRSNTLWFLTKQMWNLDKATYSNRPKTFSYINIEPN